jgi:excisionase family DNA binding protein
MQEVCDYLGVKRHSILRWFEQRGMPHQRSKSSGVSKPLISDEWVRKCGASDEREGIK